MASILSLFRPVVLRLSLPFLGVTIVASAAWQSTAQDDVSQSPVVLKNGGESSGDSRRETATVAGRPVGDWARLIDDPSAETRRMAAANLAQFGVAALPELQAAARHDDSDVRYWALRGLRRRNTRAKETYTPGAEDAIVKTATAALNDRSPAVRIVAASVLASFNRLDAARPAMVAGLSAPQSGTRILAISELARLHDLSPANLDAITRAAIRRAIDEDEQNEYVVRIARRISGESSE